jgi:hypothetical protein
MKVYKVYSRTTLPLVLVIAAALCSSRCWAQSGAGYALSFDGTNSYVQIPGFGTNAPTNEITIEFWQNASRAAQQSTFSTSPLDAGDRINAHIPYVNGNDVYWDFGGTEDPCAAPDSTGGRCLRSIHARNLRNSITLGRSIGSRPRMAPGERRSVEILGESWRGFHHALACNHLIPSQLPQCNHAPCNFLTIYSVTLLRQSF